MKTITKFQIKRNKLAKKIFTKLIATTTLLEVHNSVMSRSTEYQTASKVAEYSLEVAAIFLNTKRDMKDESFAIEEAIVEKWEKLKEED